MNVCDFSADRKYRYQLTKVVNGNTGPQCIFIGLNPSTADEERDDPTIRRCQGFARSWGYELLTMMNIFAYRSTDPRNLYLHWLDPVGPENDKFLLEFCLKANLVICAWGAHGNLHNRGDRVKTLLSNSGIALHYLGLTKHGHPKHPLYLPANLHPQKWD